jgi:hypothetical protein
LAHRYYENLVNRVDTNVPYDVFVRRIVPALGITLLPALVESIQRKQAIDTGIVLEDFKFFIKKFLMQKRYPSPTTETPDVKREYSRLGECLRKLDEQPELYKQELDALEKAVDSYKVLEEDLAKPTADLAYETLSWSVRFVEKHKLLITKEETWPNFFSCMTKLNKLLKRMDDQRRVVINPTISDGSNQSHSSNKNSAGAKK